MKSDIVVNTQVRQSVIFNDRYCSASASADATARAVIPKVKLDSPFRSKEKSDHSGRGFRLAARRLTRSEPGCASVVSELPTELGFPSGHTRPCPVAIVWAQCHCIRYRRRQNWAGQSLGQSSRSWISFDVDLERPKR